MPNGAGLDQSRNSSATTLIFSSILFVIAGAFFLHFIGQYSLVDQHYFQFFADSNTYHSLYEGIYVPRGTDQLIDVSANYAGPIAILTITGGNIYLIMIINVAIFTTSMMCICKLLKIDEVKTSALLMLSPLTVSSLLSVNKEIFIFPFIAFMIIAYKNRSVLAIIFAFIFAVLFRWQLVLFLIAMIPAQFAFNFRLVSKWLVFAASLISISVVYYYLQSYLEPVFNVAERSNAAVASGSGVFSRLIDIQQEGWYFAVFFPKAAQLLFALGVRYDTILNPIDFYNDLFVTLHCTATIVVFLALLIYRRLSLSSDLIFASILFLIIFCITPIFAPRYLHPVYVIWVLVLCGATGRLPRDPLRGDRPMLARHG